MFFRRWLSIKISAFRKILGPVSQKWIPQNSTKGGTLGRQGVESQGGASNLEQQLLKNLIGVGALRNCSYYNSQKKTGGYKLQKLSWCITLTVGDCFQISERIFRETILPYKPYLMKIGGNLALVFPLTKMNI